MSDDGDFDTEYDAPQFFDFEQMLQLGGHDAADVEHVEKYFGNEGICHTIVIDVGYLSLTYDLFHSVRPREKHTRLSGGVVTRRQRAEQ